MRVRRAALALPLLAAALAPFAACGGGGSTGELPPLLSKEQLQDPKSCQGCHPDQFREWSGSMHAYAAEDPIFLAMNARGQRETKGELGTFCVKCHAPMAVATGATKDGLNLAELPEPMRGVTCYYCHSVAEVTGTHDAALKLADDGVLRAAIRDPKPNGAHRAGHSPYLDRQDPRSAEMCGACHDIVTPPGAELERTFLEWKGSLFSHPPLALTCGQCHMDGRDGLAAHAPGVGLRRVHSHAFPGVDVALTDFPEKDTQRDLVQHALDGVLQAELCVRGANLPGATTIQVVLDNVGAGHGFPSGAAQDRRAWVEVVAYDEKDAIIYSSGTIADGEPATKSPDPDLWLLRDCLFDEKDQPVHMFWEAASHDGNMLPFPVTSNPADPAYYQTHVVRTFPRPSSTPSALAVAPARVTMRVRLRPVGLDVLDDLVASGDLDPAFRDAMPTFSLKGTELEWTPDAVTIQYGDNGIPVGCVSSGITVGANAAVPAPEHTKCAP